ncbi:minor capsid protein [Sporosarcina sp. FSL K6-1522]|uniref:minor capsid protein n=1 Tax=Sporosarcina sp. FSL K6-1522 TaxID=2921554 RepID=UPI003159FFF7
MVRVTINLTGVKKKLSQEAVNRGRYALANQAMPDMNQFVPMQSGGGILRLSAAIDADGKSIMYNTPYARAQFYGTNGKAVFSNYTTPGTGSRWDLKAKGVFMSDWINAFNKGADW